jgi:hypothetical protein
MTLARPAADYPEGKRAGIDYSVGGRTCEIDLLLDRAQSGAPAAPQLKKSG